MIDKARYNEDDDEWIIPFVKKSDLPGQTSSGQSFLPDINGNGNKAGYGSSDMSMTLNSSRSNSRGGSRGGMGSTMLLTVNGSSVTGSHYGRSHEEEQHFGTKTVNMSKLLSIGGNSQLPPTLDLQGIVASGNKEPKVKKSARKDKKPKQQPAPEPKVVG